MEQYSLRVLGSGPVRAPVVGIKDIYSERLASAAVEVLVPRICAAVTHVLLTGAQLTTVAEGITAASPAVYVLLAAFSCRMRKQFPVPSSESLFGWIQRALQFLRNPSVKPDETRTSYVSILSGFNTALEQLADAISGTPHRFYLDNGEVESSVDSAQILFDVMHVVSIFCELL